MHVCDMAHNLKVENKYLQIFDATSTAQTNRLLTFPPLRKLKMKLNVNLVIEETRNQFLLHNLFSFKGLVIRTSV